VEDFQSTQEIQLSITDLTHARRLRPVSKNLVFFVQDSDSVIAFNKASPNLKAGFHLSTLAKLVCVCDKNGCHLCACAKINAPH